MSVNRQDVETIANLARLSYTEDEQEKMSAVLNSILGYFDKLSELDTGSVEPLTHILPVQNVMRPDEIREPVGQKTALENAPESDKGHFVIPKVIE